MHGLRIGLLRIQTGLDYKFRPLLLVELLLLSCLLACLLAYLILQVVSLNLRPVLGQWPTGCTKAPGQYQRSTAAPSKDRTSSKTPGKSPSLGKEGASTLHIKKAIKAKESVAEIGLHVGGSGAWSRKNQGTPQTGTPFVRCLSFKLHVFRKVDAVHVSKLCKPIGSEPFWGVT